MVGVVKPGKSKMLCAFAVKADNINMIAKNIFFISFRLNKIYTKKLARYQRLLSLLEEPPPPLDDELEEERVLPLDDPNELLDDEERVEKLLLDEDLDDEDLDELSCMRILELELLLLSLVTEELRLSVVLPRELSCVRIVVPELLVRSEPEIERLSPMVDPRELLSRMITLSFEMPTGRRTLLLSLLLLEVAVRLLSSIPLVRVAEV